MFFELHTFLIQHPIQWLPCLSALLGLIGTVFVFVFGVPNQVDTKGYIVYTSRDIDQSEIKRIKKFKYRSYIGLILIAISFLLSFLASV